MGVVTHIPLLVVPMQFSPLSSAVEVSFWAQLGNTLNSELCRLRLPLLNSLSFTVFFFFFVFVFLFSTPSPSLFSSSSSSFCLCSPLQIVCVSDTLIKSPSALFGWVAGKNKLEEYKLNDDVRTVTGAYSCPAPVVRRSNGA